MNHATNGSAPSRTVLAARDITKRYGGVTALDSVSLEIPAGQVTCLAGENGCGKSTLIKIMVGVEVPDAGTIELGERRVARMKPRDSIQAGIQVIYQDLSLFPNLTVHENIALSALVSRSAVTVSPATTRKLARRVVDDLGVKLDLDREVGQLPVADRQLTAICRALAQDARVIFMDEPTTALTMKEVDALFELVTRLKERGLACVFVSHKLDEVMEISEQVTVLRNGKLVTSGPASDYTTRSLAHAMTGRDVFEEREITPVPDDAAPVLEVSGLCLAGAFEDVSFDVRAGQIVGITGLLGSGRSEIAEAIFGLTPADAGTVMIDGEDVTARSVQDAVGAGIGYVPADRLSQGLFLDQSIARNVMAASLDLHSERFGLLSLKRLKATIDTYFAALRIKAPSTQAPIRSLSGGNQQRVVLAKWLARSPRVLILNMPTVGVDIGSKEEILAILREQAAAGMGIVLISDDVQELVAVCHTVHIVQRGRLVTRLEDPDVTRDRIVEELAA